MSFSEKDIRDLRRLREAEGVFWFSDDEPYLTEEEALLDGALNLGLPDSQIHALWAAGVRSREAYGKVADTLQSVARPKTAGREVDAARLYFAEHIMHHSDLLSVSRGPGGRKGGNAKAQLDALDEYLDEGITTHFAGVVVERILRGPQKEQRYQFRKSGQPTKTYSRNDLLNGVIQRALRDIEEWLALSRCIELPSDK